MTSTVRLLASTRLTLLGIALLALGALLSYNKPEAPLWLLVAPLSWLAVNLTGALFVNPRLRRDGGLLVFHLALLGMILLVGAGRLMRYDGRVEISEGSMFSANEAEALRQGPWHPFRLDQVHFAQGPFSIEYANGLNRGITRSHVFVPGSDGQRIAAVIGDSTPLLLQGYRFYTTSNKGYAPLITWTPAGGRPASGTLNMPSYPQYEWMQESHWTPPGGSELKFKLHLKTGYSPNSDWVLDGKSEQTSLTIISGNSHFDLKPGDTATLPNGSLRFDELRSWMGYSIYYDPTLPWLFVVAVTGVAGLGWYYWRNPAKQQFAAAAIPSNTRSISL